MALDLSDLLTSRDDDLPSGMDCEYSPDFLELQRIGAVTPERQEGSKINPAIDPEWTEVKALALQVLSETHDLRAAGYLAQAALHTDGFAGFAEVLRYFRETLETYWDSVFPQLDADDDDDPTARINAVQLLTDNDTMLRYLRSAPITESRSLGYYTLRDMQMASGELTAPRDVEVPEQSTISAAFQDTREDILAAKLTAVNDALAHLRGIDRAFSANLGSRGPNLDAVIRLLMQIQKPLSAHVTLDDGADAPSDDFSADEDADGKEDVNSSEAPSAARGVSAPSGQISSNRDVTMMLDRILAYYERYEPSSPVPLILQRAKRLVGADFMTILRDLAPQGISDVTMISGSNDD